MIHQWNWTDLFAKRISFEVDSIEICEVRTRWMIIAQIQFPILQERNISRTFGYIQNIYGRLTVNPRGYWLSYHMQCSQIKSFIIYVTVIRFRTVHAFRRPLELFYVHCTQFSNILITAILGDNPLSKFSPEEFFYW